jgi:Na+/citrate or Na+/malate symporter
MKTKGTTWKWAWWLLLAGVGLQFYFVQELVAAFAFFAIGFAALALVIVTLHMLQKGWEAAVGRFTNSEGLSGTRLASRKAGAGDAQTACEGMLP